MRRPAAATCDSHEQAGRDEHRRTRAASAARSVTGDLRPSRAGCSRRVVVLDELDAQRVGAGRRGASRYTSSTGVRDVASLRLARSPSSRRLRRDLVRVEVVVEVALAECLLLVADLVDDVEVARRRATTVTEVAGDGSPPSFGELIDTDGRSSGSTAVAVAGRLAAGPVADGARRRPRGRRRRRRVATDRTTRASRARARRRPSIGASSNASRHRGPCVREQRLRTTD